MERPVFMVSLQGIAGLPGADVDGSTLERLQIDVEGSDERAYLLMGEITAVLGVWTVDAGGNTYRPPANALASQSGLGLAGETIERSSPAARSSVSS